MWMDDNLPKIVNGEWMDSVECKSERWRKCFEEYYINLCGCNGKLLN